MKKLVRVTINLTPRAMAALDRTKARTGGNKTDAINQALLVYQLYLDLTDQSGGELVTMLPDGTRERIHLV